MTGALTPRQGTRSILVYERASIRDPELKAICFKPNGIIASQVREIDQMKAS
jgi:hypothetical protein